MSVSNSILFNSYLLRPLPQPQQQPPRQLPLRVHRLPLGIMMHLLISVPGDRQMDSLLHMIHYLYAASTRVLQVVNVVIHATLWYHV